MKAERWQRVNDLFQSAAERAPEERTAFLDEACHGDKELSREVESLLASYERAENFIELPAFEIAPELLTNESRTGALVGELIGHYRIESLIGVGGMGEVYLARDERLGRKVALKLLSERFTTDEMQLSRFKTEARSASALNHPNILTVYEIGAEGNRQFIATEFIEGITLRASLARGRMNVRDALQIAIQVASALAAAHETGVVHRDIKPENIMLRPDGYAKVLDFGIAKLTEQRPASDLHDVGTTTILQTRPGLVLGTAHYMSPEQTRGQSVDARSDIWSLGVVLYEMVEGIPPFPGKTPSDCIASILTMEPPPLSGVSPEVPLKLQWIVQKALRKNREERYRAIKEMLADLRNLKGELEAEGSSPQTKARAESIVSKIKRHKRGMLFTLAAAILATAAFAYSFYFVAPAPSPSEKSIAVLPFVNMSSDKEQEYFSDGLSEELLNQLAQIPQLRVIARTSSFSFKGKEVAVATIARALNVANVLEGSVRKSGNTLRITAELVRASDSSQLWSKTYDRDLTDVFKVQDEIAGDVVAALKVKLLPTQELPKTQRTNNPEAYEHYLLGMNISRQDRLETSQLAAVEFQKAIALDPNYANAYVALSIAQSKAAEVANSQAQRAAEIKQSFARMEVAITLAPDLAIGYSRRGYLRYTRAWDWQGATADFKRALALDPNNAELLSSYSQSLFFNGHQEEAIALARKATLIDPLSLDIWHNLGLLLFCSGQDAEARLAWQHALDIYPGARWPNYLMGYLDLKEGKNESARAHFRASDEPFRLTGTAMVEHTLGHASESEQALDALRTKYAAGSAFQIAAVYAWRGEKDHAFEWLDRAYDQHDAGMPRLRYDPTLASLHNDPRFAALVKKMGFAE